MATDEFVLDSSSDWIHALKRDLVVVQFLKSGTSLYPGVIPKVRFHQRAEGSPSTIRRSGQTAPLPEKFVTGLL
jgi:hypothetical protein